MVRTSACHAEGREFESRRSRHYKADQENLVGVFAFGVLFCFILIFYIPILRINITLDILMI